MFPRSFFLPNANVANMRLVGYISDSRENAFKEPVYQDNKGNYYRHEIDSRHNIVGFLPIEDNKSEITKLYFSKKFSVGKKAALVFQGKENYLHYQEAPAAIEEVIHYLNDHSNLYKVDGALDQAMMLKSKILSDHFVVDNFVVKMNPDEEQIILSFDFPSPKKEVLTENAVKKSTTEISSTDNSTTAADEKEAIFSKAIKQLNSVDMNFELKLKLRADERRSKLKTFNYQFKLNQNSSRRKKASE